MDQRLRIVVVGAGLGGLAAAFCFSRKGHDVKLFERRQELSNKGGGVSIRPGATQVMISWGLKEQFDAVSDDYATTLFRDQYTGEIINRSIAVEVSDSPDWGTERGEIQRILCDNAIKAGAELNMGCQVDDVQEGVSEASVVLGDGSAITADIILVADGIRSRLRPKILAGASVLIDPIASDVTLYGMKIPLEEARNNTALTKVCQDTNLNVSLGRGSFVVFRAHEKLQSFGILFGIEGVTDQKGLWDEEGDIEHVRKVFSDSDPALVSALRLAKSCDRWRLAEMPDLPRWTSTNGRIVLLGDSAHSMYPNAAQGFSQIIEDIGALEYLLSFQKSVKFVTSAWEKIRKPRVERIKAYARENTLMFLGKAPRPPKMTPGQQKAIGQRVRSLKGLNPDSTAPFHTAPFYKWAYDHDVVKEAQKYLSEERGAKL